MIHTNRIVTVGEQESVIDRPIVLYRGDREVEIEFTLVGNEFMFSTEGNVIKSTNASHGQLVLNTPSGENMFSALAECHEGKVVFVVTKEMIDELIETGFYSFQIRLYDSEEMRSRVTIPPVMNGFDIRNPIAAEDETNVVDVGLVDYSRIVKDQSNEELPTFDWNGNYNKTEWEHHDVITENKMNKIEDALYSFNDKLLNSDMTYMKQIKDMETKHQNDVNSLNAKDKQLGDEIDEVNRTITNRIDKLEVDVEVGHLFFEDEFVKHVNEQLGEIVYERNSELFNLNKFKKLDEDIDDTDRIQRALDYCVDNDLTLLIPHGEFIVSQRGTNLLTFLGGDRGYCIYKENCKINIIQLGTIKVDLGDSNIRPNIFTFKKCEVKFSGGIFEGLNNNGNKKLYSGNPIILDTCYNSVIDKVETYSTNGGPLLFKCINSIISNCYFENTSQSMGCCGSAFGIYGGEHNEIFKCISYGSTGDGDIALYGAGNSNKVTNSKCFNSLHDLVITNTGAQGICVDAGQNNCVVSECYAYGYYYGIDVKTNIENCKVINNIVERCKVGLALRYGEAGGDNVFAIFRGNTVLNPYNGRDNLINNESYWCGFFIEKSYGVSIKDNVIINSPFYILSEKGSGIIINDVNRNEAYNKEMIISGNHFYDQTSIANKTNPLHMDNIYINLAHAINNINITNNSFTGGYGSKNTTVFINIVKARCVHITNNLFGRIDNTNGALLCGDIKALNINSNTFKQCKGLLVASNMQELNIANNIFEGCLDWKPLVTGSITGVCNFTSNIFKANSTNAGTLVSLNGGKKLIATNNILYMGRGSRDEFIMDSSTVNVINTNNYIEHTN